MKTGLAQPMRWVSGWQNLDSQRSVKRHFRLYLSVETENRTRSKTLVFPAGTKQRCVPFHLCGRRFRLKLESESRVPWQLVGGLQLEMDVEEND